MPDCPLPLDVLPKPLQKHADGKAPVPLRMMGAKGLVPAGAPGAAAETAAAAPGAAAAAAVDHVPEPLDIPCCPSSP